MKKLLSRLLEIPDVLLVVGGIAIVAGVAHFSYAVASIVAGVGLVRLALLLGAARRNPPSPPSD
jgi:hypothetical protein